MGVILVVWLWRYLIVCIPHTGGGDPHFQQCPASGAMYSPHGWGWSHDPNSPRARPHVFPTRVGVIPLDNPLSASSSSIPHTGGGDPPAISSPILSLEYSPHGWGWSQSIWLSSYVWWVFPTRVGVIPTRIHLPYLRQGIPHTGGGDPVGVKAYDDGVLYSPHGWGWSLMESTLMILHWVFPTRVGVIPRHA